MQQVYIPTYLTPNNKGDSINLSLSNKVSKEDIYNALSENPKSLIITDEAVEIINDSINDPCFDGFKFMDSLITYKNALDNSKCNFTEYLNAIRFCAYLDASEGNVTKAYINAFIKRDFVKERMHCPKDSSEWKQLNSASSRYRKSPLVVSILTQSEIPMYLMFQGYRYKAIERLVYEMDNAKSSRDRINASDKLLLHLKPPENLTIDIGFKQKEESILDQYEKAIFQMASKQRELIVSGENRDDIINAEIVVE